MSQAAEPSRLAGGATLFPDPRPNKRKLQAAATRQRVLDAAREVFESRGYQAASVATITKAADTAHGTFYLYFKNKDDAFVQVVADVAEQMRQESRARLSDDRYEGIEGVIRGFLVVFAEHAPLWRALLEGMMQSPIVEQAWRDVADVFIDRIAHRIEREQEAGIVRLSLDPRAAAQALAAMTEWYAFRCLADKAPASSNVSDASIDEAVKTLTDLWYHAVYGRTDRDQ
jgi:AcrR family transcriptional regulator